MGRPDLLVVDLDGTLLGTDGAVSNENAAALRRASESGFPCLIATGRTLSECESVLESIDYRGTLIAASGSLLLDVEGRRTIRRRVLESELVSQIVDCVLDAHPMAMILKDRHQAGVDYVFVGVGDLHPVSHWWIEHTGATFHRVDRVEDDPHPHDTVRIGAIGGPTEFMPMVSRLEKHFGDNVLARHWEAVTSSEHAGEPVHLLEVFHPDADKWTMIQSHCDDVGLDARRAAAVGDGLNDVLMIEQCGIGIAMANADHRVLAVANSVTGGHNEHGVATLIDDLLDGRLCLNGECSDA